MRIWCCMCGILCRRAILFLKCYCTIEEISLGGVNSTCYWAIRACQITIVNSNPNIFFIYWPRGKNFNIGQNSSIVIFSNNFIYCYSLLTPKKITALMMLTQMSLSMTFPLVNQIVNCFKINTIIIRQHWQIS